MGTKTTVNIERQWLDSGKGLCFKFPKYLSAVKIIKCHFNGLSIPLRITLLLYDSSHRTRAIPPGSRNRNGVHCQAPYAGLGDRIAEGSGVVTINDVRVRVSTHR